ncbi:hypothetical protein pipiens_003106 [Culex pipiens pipiens]|uniref:Uncharacterized protein n=1 Tax=Culex pipiens pipiens TaxID=38569 RepID=A0ABD1D3L3_CULPP
MQNRVMPQRDRDSFTQALVQSIQERLSEPVLDQALPPVQDNGHLVSNPEVVNTQWVQVHRLDSTHTKESEQVVELVLQDNGRPDNILEELLSIQGDQEQVVDNIREQEPPVNIREVPHISLGVYLGIILERDQDSIPRELVNILEQEALAAAQEFLALAALVNTEDNRAEESVNIRVRESLEVQDINTSREHLDSIPQERVNIPEAVEHYLVQEQVNTTLEELERVAYPVALVNMEADIPEVNIPVQEPVEFQDILDTPERQGRVIILEQVERQVQEQVNTTPRDQEWEELVQESLVPAAVESVSIPVRELLEDTRTPEHQVNIPEPVEYLVQEQVNTTLEEPEWEAYLAALVNTEVNWQPVQELDWDNRWRRQYPGGQYPGTGAAGGPGYTGYPGTPGAGQYPGTSGMPGVGGGQYYPGGTGAGQAGVGGAGIGQTGGVGTGGVGVGQQAGYRPGQRPSSVDQYPSTIPQGGVAQGGQGGGDAANVQLIGDDDDSFSQAETSVKNGEAMASAQGRKNGGTAQTQVSGTYTATGSFSASAQTSDSDRSAQSQVSGGKDGALSSAQGTGGIGKSQSQVQVNSKTGGTSATSQSGGLGHESQSEVVANEKGGLADAQSSGPGQTSSQAQIGFRPQGEDNGQVNIFNGGGQASAQSGAHTGQSQSQISGNFNFGISYHGAAQAASGNKEQVSRYREKGKQLFQSIGLFGKTNNGASVRRESDVVDPQGLRLRTSQQSAVSDFQSLIPKPNEEPEYEEEDEEYEEDDYETTDTIPVGAKAKPFKPPSEDEEKKTTIVELPPPTLPALVTTVRPNRNYNINNGNGKTFSQNAPTQKQTAVVSNLDKYKVVQTQNGKTTVHDAATEAIPTGFSDIHGQQTTVLQQELSTPGATVEVPSTTPKLNTRYLPSKHLDANGNRIPAGGSAGKHQPNPDSYISVTKQVTGIDENSKVPAIPGKNYESTYYTKSSTCGYFTFSCNIVYGENGRSKICRPKPPTNGKC